MIEPIRYVLGVLNAVLVPLGVIYWLVIHLWARRWRKWGLARTYLAVLPVLTALGVLLFRWRRQLLGTDLGTNWGLIGIALVLFCPVVWLELQYWKQLSISTLVGIPELSERGQGGLIRDGVYGKVRHPRYLSAGIGLIATTLIVNYLGLYIILLCAVLPGYLILALEERELVDRFGDAYRDYQKSVPQLIPRLRRPG
jgi:protein-S-isoprenylcysteine O-methyltransferase Ste14